MYKHILVATDGSTLSAPANRVCECYKMVKRETERLFPAGDFLALKQGAAGAG